MELSKIEEIERIMEEWDGKVAVDTYHLEESSGFVVFSLVKEDRLLNALSFQGNRDEVIFLLREILPRKREKIVDTQWEDVKKIGRLIGEYPSQ